MKKRLIRYFIALAVSLILALGIFALQSGFSDAKNELNRIMCDTTFSVGVIYLAAGLLIWVNNLGAFDILAYGMFSFLNIFRKKSDDRKFVDYMEYKERKKADSLPWLFLAIIGIIYIVIAACYLQFC